MAKLAMLNDTTFAFIWGISLQALLTVFAPIRVALLPAVVLLVAKALYELPASVQSVTSTVSENKALRGRWTAQLPRGDGSGPLDGAEAEVVCFIIGASSNHPLGRAAPGFEELGQHFQLMWKEAEADRQNSGLLGRSITLTKMTPETTDFTLLVLSYWKDVEALRAFAQGPAHRAGWDWWNKVTRSHPHLGIMHEVFAAPKGHWENIYINFKPFGMGLIKHSGGDGQSADGSGSSLVRAKGAKWKSMLGRMDRVDEFEGYKARDDDD